ncbi:hypothetical protein LJ656_34440 [Paraburkholderia sp. MMS20-SJTR3]|uniref:Uncharacterized protein n=1 Tax=Paraburkholderia sejongensis TaxID=2886946 RepID=A0ABS8K670_9BURK|nr:hypothetical protein [Paraburkholderia sp. MMS20-SJTR3]MCC8397643.1 hypothetical protein [Paraburkholderia sp. MMS20-SJTR3]
MFGLYPAGSEWVRVFALDDQHERDIQKSLVDHAGFTPAILHQPFGKDRGAVLAQSGPMLVLRATTPGANQVVVTAAVEMQHLLWSYHAGMATQWSPLEIRTLTGYAGWDELLTCARREFARACEKVEAAIAGKLHAPVAVAERVDPMVESFPDDDDVAFYSRMAAMSESMEVSSCGL